MGCAECVRGLLAFIACPAFGKISDVLGRKVCLFITVLGTCSPVCSLAVMSLQNHALDIHQQQQTVWMFVVLLALSGIFSSTFTLTFAYISDTVKKKKDRVTAYGLALATFGLSFTIGPMAGGYLAHVGDIYTDSYTASSIAQDEGNGMEDIMHSGPDQNYLHPLGQRRVFCTALILTILDLLYIYFILPESVPDAVFGGKAQTRSEKEEEDEISVVTCDTRRSFTDQWNSIRDIVPNAWSPFDTLRIFSGDPFMYEVGTIALLYYTALWAVVSTLTLYAAKRFHMGPERLGELMSALGLSTMISEAVLVRIVVPSIGEKRSMRVGLIAFSFQCIVLGFAYEGWHLFICVLLSTASNLVYPSLTSLVSSAVSQDMVGEALGAVNGVKALTEGIGPLLFGTLMTFSEKTPLPGWPYLLASFFAMAAYKRAARLPDEDDEEYLSERFMRPTNMKAASALSEIELERSSQDKEYVGLLSQVDESECVSANEQLVSDLGEDHNQNQRQPCSI